MIIKILFVSAVVSAVILCILTVLIFIMIPIKRNLLAAIGGLLVSTGLFFSVKDKLINPFMELSEKDKLTSVVKDDIINSLKPQNTVQSQSDITSNENETVDNIQNQDVSEQEIIVNCY